MVKKQATEYHDLVAKVMPLDRRAYSGSPKGYPTKSAVFGEVVKLYSKWKDIDGNDHWAYDSTKSTTQRINKPITTTQALDIVDQMLKDLVKTAEGK